MLALHSNGNVCRINGVIKYWYTICTIPTYTDNIHKFCMLSNMYIFYLKIARFYYSFVYLLFLTHGHTSALYSTCNQKPRHQLSAQSTDSQIYSKFRVSSMLNQRFYINWYFKPQIYISEVLYITIGNLWPVEFPKIRRKHDSESVMGPSTQHLQRWLSPWEKLFSPGSSLWSYCKYIYSYIHIYFFFRLGKHFFW